jgi:hypothetical protein
MNDKYKDNPVFKKYGYKLFSYIYSDIGYLDSQKIISLFEFFRRSLEYKSLKTGLKTVKSSKGSKRTLKKVQL